MGGILEQKNELFRAAKPITNLMDPKLLMFSGYFYRVPVSGWRPTGSGTPIFDQHRNRNWAIAFAPFWGVSHAV